MILGTGIDIVEVRRIRRALEGTRSMQERVFTPGEVEYCRARKNCYQHFAGRFAAKEAALKALGTGWGEGIRWKDVEVVEGEKGRPRLLFHARAEEIFQASGAGRAHLSITHSSAQALAVVILEE